MKTKEEFDKELVKIMAMERNIWDMPPVEQTFALGALYHEKAVGMGLL